MVNNRDATGWKMFKVSTVENRFEEDMVTQALEKRGIPYLIRRFSDTAYDGIFIPQKGWAVVMVPHEYRKRAKAVIKDLKRDYGV